MKKLESEISRLYDTDMYIPTRTIFMQSQSSDMDDNESGVDYEMYTKVAKGLHVLDNINQEPVTIIGNNSGGYVYHGMAIYSMIKKCNSHVTMKMYGQCQSMGTIILQAADMRIIDEHCLFMIHYGSDNDYSNVKEKVRYRQVIDADMKTTEDIYIEKILEKHEGQMEVLDLVLQKICYRMGAEWSRLKEKGLERLLRKNLKSIMTYDAYLTAQEVLDLGLADKIC